MRTYIIAIKTEKKNFLNSSIFIIWKKNHQFFFFFFENVTDHSPTVRLPARNELRRKKEIYFFLFRPKFWLGIGQGSDRPWKTWKTWKKGKFWKKPGKLRETQGIFFIFLRYSGKLREFFSEENSHIKYLGINIWGNHCYTANYDLFYQYSVNYLLRFNFTLGEETYASTLTYHKRGPFTMFIYQMSIKT